MFTEYRRETDWMDNVISFAGIGMIPVIIFGYLLMVWMFRVINHPSQTAFKTAFKDLFKRKTYTGWFATAGGILAVLMCLMYLRAWYFDDLDSLKKGESYYQGQFKVDDVVLDSTESDTLLLGNKPKLVLEDKKGNKQMLRPPKYIEDVKRGDNVLVKVRSQSNIKPSLQYSLNSYGMKVLSVEKR